MDIHILQLVNMQLWTSLYIMWESITTFVLVTMYIQMFKITFWISEMFFLTRKNLFNVFSFLYFILFYFIFSLLLKSLFVYLHHSKSCNYCMSVHLLL